MDETLVPFLLVVLVPLGYLVWRFGGLSTPILRTSFLALLVGLLVTRLPAYDFTDQFRNRFDLLLAGVAVALLALRHGGAPWLVARRNWLTALGALSLAALLGYGGFLSFHGFGSFVHRHDIAHYYLGSKYFPELGYGNLYVGMLRAELEELGHLSSPQARELAGNYLVPVETLLARSDAVKASFSGPRWRDFRKDVRAFRDTMGTGYADVVRDHGYNPTPVWAFVGGLVANRVPAGNFGRISLLALLDPLLIAVSFSAVAWVFGVETALLGLIYFCICFGAGFTWTGGAFLRQLSLTCIVAAACAIGRGSFGIAGLSLAVAAALRLYPALLAVPLLCQGLGESVRTRRISREHLRFTLGFTAGIIALVGATLIQPQGIQRWGEFSENLQSHMRSASSNLIGLTGWLTYWGSSSTTDDADVEDLIERRQTVNRVQLATVFVAAVGMVAVLSQRVDPLRAMAAGSILVLTGLNLSGYYYSFLVLLVLAFRDRPRDLALIFAVELLTYATHLFEQHAVMIYLYKSLLILELILVLYLAPGTKLTPPSGVR